MMNKLLLTSFRKFESYKLDITKDILIISGDNAKGKSTILEAIFMLTNGYSPWNSFEEIFNEQTDPAFFRIEGEINGKEYAIYKTENSRQLTLDKKKTVSRKFFEDIYSIVFSPEIIEILMISPSKRREFIDRYICDIDIEYEDWLKRFNRVLRHRNAYLKKLSKYFFDTGVVPEYDTQVKIWSKEMSILDARIMKKREEFFSQISDKQISFKYVPAINLSSMEELFDIEQMTTFYEEQLKSNFKRDIALGYTNIGIHRDDWEIETEKNVKKYGSRGEKRLAIIEMIYRINTLIKDVKGTCPILLLDDVPSELDIDNTKIILEKAVALKQQIVITTLDINLIPKDITSQAQIVDLNSFSF